VVGNSLDLFYETQLTGELVTGTLSLQIDTSSDDSLTFCRSDAEGGCDAMMCALSWDDVTLVFDTSFGGTLHAGIRLSK
jgi:hypothetical protein